MCFAPQRRALFQHLVRTWCALYILTWKCASRHNGVHFFDIATSKSGPRMVCFVHFHLQMCFAPQRRALFQHLNFQKWSGAEVLCTFWLRNVLRATTACNSSSLIWPDGSAPATLASLLFDPPEPRILGKTECFATFLPFRASASSFFWLFLSYHLLSSALLFSDSSHLCFSSVHIVGSLTSKLPSMMTNYMPFKHWLKRALVTEIQQIMPEKFPCGCGQLEGKRKTLRRTTENRSSAERHRCKAANPVYTRTWELWRLWSQECGCEIPMY